ncbi:MULTISPECIES: CheR family methyltransferase [Actinoplanes]|uniref:CheR family methyltransferase n=1 Tax=Actinoplanes TaxID=1865 RepID=UPI0005F2ED17|nr:MULTISPECIES: CheR family methyltransferase [Actinoplanes]GLY00276.1 protein-glutamate O-methyltransferase [Actinoplanes sp. NBRC 101535]
MTSFPAGLTRFRDLLQQRLGWTFADADVGQMEKVLRDRAAAHELSERDYLDRLTGRRWDAELAVLAEELSITETYFFRHSEQFRVVAARVLPERILARSAQRVLRLLSVGCSSGEEAYTLAILATEARPHRDWIVSVVGLDANRRQLRKANAATYSAWSLRETPDRAREKWFRQSPEGYHVSPEITAAAHFMEYNVADDDPQLWQPGRYDVIFCRNLLMYLTPDVVTAVVGRMTRSLDTGGYLFLGHTDSLGSRPEGLEVLHEAGTVFYRRPGAGHQHPPTASRPARPAPVANPAEHYSRAFALMRDDRFADALAAISEPPPAGVREVLLYGVLLAQMGRLDEARAAAHRLIDTGGPHPDGHHLLGVCHELDCADQAVGQYRLAAYLDPAFAMPQLRMGLLARRRGDDRGAAALLRTAQDLMLRESDDRIVLFGGGFSRIALVSLCRTELESCGVPR